MTLDKMGIVAAVVLAAVALFVGFQAPSLEAVRESIKANLPIGAVSGPDRFNECESANGITRCFTRKGLAVGTTTSCAIKAPRNGTSTLIVASAVVTAGTNDITTAVTFSKGLTMQASTTALSGSFASVADSAGSFIASTTNTETTRLFGPADWLQVNFQGGVGTASTTGFCNATFELI